MFYPELELGYGEFAQGYTEFGDSFPDDKQFRIVIYIKINNKEIPAIVDTGSQYCILNCEHAEGFEELESIEASIQIRGVDIQGSLCRIPLVLEATKGEGLHLDVTFFIPDCSNENFKFPNFIGLSLLQSIRFAIDPETDRFYFGELGG